MSSSYSEKIKELRSTAQETQAAIKIQDKLNELRSKDVVISSYRWIWELIQNAKDCTNSSGKIDIEIIFDSVRKIVEFKHNGKLFATKNIVYLIEQVSTKVVIRGDAIIAGSICIFFAKSGRAQPTILAIITVPIREILTTAAIFKSWYIQ